MRNFDDLLAELDETRMWEQALESEPFPQVWIAGDRVDAAFTAIAALTGLKSPWLREHSTGVAELAEAAAWRMGLPADSVTLLRRAALAHDLGRVGVSNAIWEKPGPLGFGEWERVRLHPHFTERAFAQSPALAPIGMLAGSHHERLDGSGYHRGTRGPALDQAARILAAADCYAAMREARPYRPALDAPAAEAELLREAEEGRLDPDAVDAVLNAAGHRVRQRPRELPAGLTERELEVLLVLVRGESNQAIAEDLGISAKTVGHHVQHVYEKAGVRSRAAATVWAFEHDLVRAGRPHGIGRSPDAARPSERTLAPPSASSGDAETTEEERDDPGNDDGRGLRPLRGDLLDEGRREAEGSTARRARPSFAIPTRTTGSGRSSTGMRRAGRASPPTPRSRRSCRKPGTRVGPRCWSSAAGTTPSTSPWPPEGRPERSAPCP